MQYATERKGWPIAEWGKANYGFSRSFSYKLVAEGKVRTAKILGTSRTIVTREADEEFRRNLD